MRDPYRARPDFQRYSVIFVAVLTLLVAALVAFYVFRPTDTAAERRASEALSAQMNAAQQASHDRNSARRAEQAREMQ